VDEQYDDDNALDIQVDDLLDSEILAIEQVLLALARKAGTHADLESHRREIIERFAEIGFVVDVQVWETNVEGCWIFRPVLTARIEGKAFDHERMAHEVQHDILGLGTPGTIHTTKSGIHVVRDPRKVF
jgi:hypothetical protein